jgi:hypothetical protein
MQMDDRAASDRSINIFSLETVAEGYLQPSLKK